MHSNDFLNCFSPESILLAWERILSSVGTDAKDYFGINVFKSNLSFQLENLHNSLIDGNYTPERPFKYFEPKINGTQRTKTVLNIEDAIVYQAIANHVAELSYDYLSETRQFVFGSVLNSDVKKGVSILEDDLVDFYFFEYYVSLYNRFVESINETVDENVIQYRLETDITSFFDTIPHSTLIIELNGYDVEEDILDLLTKCLNFWSGTRDSMTIGVGIPQGPAASYFFANIILDSLDRIAIEKGLRYYRFMDDIRIYDTNIKNLNTALIDFDRHLKSKSLSVNIQKTSIQKVNHLDEEKAKLLDSSGIKINLDSPEVDIDILEHDSSQKSGDEVRNIEALSELEAADYYKIALIEIESNLLDIYALTIDDDTLYSTYKSDIKLVREFLTLAQKWRLITKNLIDIEDHTPNDKMIDIWLFGISKIYWKANNLIWNLSLYDNLENHYDNFNMLFDEFKDYEWVKYELLAVYGKSVNFNDERIKDVVSKIVIEESPLVRLGYYKMLIDQIKLNSQIIDSISILIKSEHDTFVKNMILNLIQQKNLNVSIDILKNWFL